MVVGAVLVALIIKTFVMQAFFIPSESMVPTLKINDRVLVNKLSYRLHDVNRGDIIVFERPEGESNDQVKDLIKRVIALPGESLVINDNKIYINGQQLAEPYLPAGTINTPGPGGATWTHKCTTDDPCVVPATLDLPAKQEAGSEQELNHGSEAPQNLTQSTTPNVDVAGPSTAGTHIRDDLPAMSSAPVSAMSLVSMSGFQSGCTIT